MRHALAVAALALGCQVAEEKVAPDGAPPGTGLLDASADARRGQPATVDFSIGPGAPLDAQTSDATPTDAAVPDATPDAAPDAAPLSPCPGDVLRIEPTATASHADAGSTLDFNHNPPTSGPHYSRWAPSGDYADRPLDRGYWLHNLEHGWLVLLYHPDANPAAVQALRDAGDSLPDDPRCPAHKRWIITPDPFLDSQVAAVTWNHVIEGHSLTVESIHAMFVSCREEAPEVHICRDGEPLR